MSEHTPDHIATAADLGRRDAERKPEPYALTGASALVVAKVRCDEEVRRLSLERYLSAPLRTRGTATLHSPDDFAAYVNRLADPHTTLWADIEHGSVTAMLDDHLDSDTAGWRSHTVRLTLPPDPDWVKWLRFDEKLIEQAPFAEFIEQMTHTIVSPSAADMLEMVTTFQAKRNVSFRQEFNLTSGDLQLTYDEETKASTRSGHIEVPREFTVSLSPWITVSPVELTAKLRHRIENGRLTIGYTLIRPDLALREAFDGVVNRIAEQVEHPMHLGVAPSPVDPQS